MGRARVKNTIIRAMRGAAKKSHLYNQVTKYIVTTKKSFFCRYNIFRDVIIQIALIALNIQY